MGTAATPSQLTWDYTPSRQPHSSFVHARSGHTKKNDQLMRHVGSDGEVEQDTVAPVGLFRMHTGSPLFVQAKP